MKGKWWASAFLVSKDLSLSITQFYGSSEMELVENEDDDDAPLVIANNVFFLTTSLSQIETHQVLC